MDRIIDGLVVTVKDLPDFDRKYKWRLRNEPARIENPQMNSMFTTTALGYVVSIREGYKGEAKMKTVGNNIWEELGRREAMIRSEYANKRIALKPGQGLALALEQSNALAANVKSTKSASDAAVQEVVQAFHVIYSIAESIELCPNSGLDITRQLSQMASGTTDFGTPTHKNSRIYFKDFEYELFIASCLIRRGLKPEFLEDRSDR